MLHPYQKSAIKRDSEAFDDISNEARLQAEATSNGAFPDPVESALISILFENEKELRRLRMR